MVIDYENDYLVTTFTDLLKKYYYEKGVIFIKVNPNIKIGKVDDNFNTIYNGNQNIINLLKRVMAKAFLPPQTS